MRIGTEVLWCTTDFIRVELMGGCSLFFSVSAREKETFRFGLCLMKVHSSLFPMLSHRWIAAIAGGRAKTTAYVCLLLGGAYCTRALAIPILSCFRNFTETLSG